MVESSSPSIAFAPESVSSRVAAATLECCERLSSDDAAAVQPPADAAPSSSLVEEDRLVYEITLGICCGALWALRNELNKPTRKDLVNELQKIFARENGEQMDLVTQIAIERVSHLLPYLFAKNDPDIILVDVDAGTSVFSSTNPFAQSLTRFPSASDANASSSSTATLAPAMSASTSLQVPAPTKDLLDDLADQPMVPLSPSSTAMSTDLESSVFASAQPSPFSLPPSATEPSSTSALPTTASSTARPLDLSSSTTTTTSSLYPRVTSDLDYDLGLSASILPTPKIPSEDDGVMTFSMNGSLTSTTTQRSYGSQSSSTSNSGPSLSDVPQLLDISIRPTIPLASPERSPLTTAVPPSDWDDSDFTSEALDSAAPVQTPTATELEMEPFQQLSLSENERKAQSTSAPPSSTSSSSAASQTQTTASISNVPSTQPSVTTAPAPTSAPPSNTTRPAPTSAPPSNTTRPAAPAPTAPTAAAPSSSPYPTTSYPNAQPVAPMSGYSSTPSSYPDYLPMPGSFPTAPAPSAYGAAPASFSSPSSAVPYYNPSSTAALSYPSPPPSSGVPYYDPSSTAPLSYSSPPLPHSSYVPSSATRPPPQQQPPQQQQQQPQQQHIKTLMELGFPESSARRALVNSRGDVELAAAMLLSEADEAQQEMREEGGLYY